MERVLTHASLLFASVRPDDGRRARGAPAPVVPHSVATLFSSCVSSRTRLWAAYSSDWTVVARTWVRSATARSGRPGRREYRCPPGVLSGEQHIPPATS